MNKRIQFFNYKNYIQLLKKSKIQKLSKLEDSELRSYRVFVYHQALYNNRLGYKKLIVKFLEKKIDVIEFALQFIKFNKKVSKTKDGLAEDFEFLKSFQVNLNVQKFGKLTFKIWDICIGVIDDGFTDEESGKINEPKIYNLIQEQFLELEKID